MCGYSATKYAVWCVKMCGCDAEKFGGTKCAETVRQSVRVCCEIRELRDEVRQSCDGTATKWRRRATTDRQDRIIMWIVVTFIKKTAFQSVAIILTIKTGIKCNSWFKCCDYKTRFLSLQKGSMVSVIVASASSSSSRFINIRKMFDAQWSHSMANINLCKSPMTYCCDSTHSFRDIDV